MIKIFDGAMGTMLQRGGLKAGACPELMNVDNPEVVKKIHQAYIDAGANIITTNTFGASSIKLAHYEIENRARELNFAAVKIAKEVAGSDVKVAGDIGPTGKFISPLGDLDFEDAYKIFYEQAKFLAEAGADYLIIETCIDIQEMRAALLAAHDVCNLPVICQLSYSEGGRTVTGTDAKTAAVILDAMGASVIGVNCSLGPEQLVPVVKILAENSSVPISVQPNAGMPYLEDGVTKFPMDAKTFGSWGIKLAEAGAKFLGGCCGTTPEHIKALSLEIKSWSLEIKSWSLQKNLPAVEKISPRRLILASRSKTVTIDENLPTVLIGERINPTGRKKLAAEIREGSLLGVKKDAVNQVKAGAQILDVNMGVGGIDQAAMMKKAVKEIAQITDAPLAIDTGDEKSLEAALRIYPGRALINSVSYEPARLEKFLPLAKKYGAAILVLPVTEKGVPKTAEERVEVAGKIIDAAKKFGLRDGDFLLDGLVMTISADADACHEVLKTLKLYREKFGYPSTMGLSNISFGLPNRPLINSTFFAMCLAAGLDAPIMNPYSEPMQNVLKASAALLGHDPNGLNFSVQLSTLSERPKVLVETQNVIETIKISVMTGAKDEVAAQIKQAIDEGHDANEITEKSLTAAMNDLGEDFGAGKIFLPQVLLSAETMKVAFDELKKLLPNQAAATQGTFVIATVKGDVHDLGKNIVGALLANSGFKLIDLGKDVDASEIVRAAIENDADIVGLCALMTTTMIQIDKVIAELKAAGATAKVMVGGAALTQEYADAAGADAYAKDGVAAVKLAKSMISTKA